MNVEGRKPEKKPNQTMQKPDFRNNIVSVLTERIHEACTTHRVPTELWTNHESTIMEIGIYNRSLQEAKTRNIKRAWSCQAFVDVYVRVLHRVYCNVMHAALFTQLVVDKSMAPQTPAFLTFQELHTELWTPLLVAQQAKDNHEDRQQAGMDMDCRKCRQVQPCTFYTMQTRSADEPATTFYKCTVCGTQGRK